MRFLIAIFVLWAVSLSAPPVRADQNAPELEQLFQQLHDAPNPKAARPIEQRIWHFWMSHEDNAVNVLMGTGIEQMAQRDYDAALATFKEMADIAPEFAEAWNKRATVEWLLGDYQDSLSDIDKTLALEPRHFGALSGRGLVYTSLEEWDRALEAFENALQVYPQMIGPRVNAEAIRQMLERREI
jgi:tetratricopeptide (TPR) repeat protein